MKYQLDEELRPLTKQKIPENPKLLPIMNSFAKVFSCKSDDFVEVTEHKICGYQDAELNTLLIEPRNMEGPLPCLVYFHGGGFMLKSSAAHYQLVKEYAAKVPCKVVFADYRLAPKYPFPIPVEDCFMTYRWVLENAEELSIDQHRIMVSGDSAGGNLVAAVTLMVRDRGLQMPVKAMLIYPVTDRRMQTESMQKYTDSPVWDANLTKMMWELYLGGQKPQPVEYASPIEAPSFEKFPPTYIEVAEFDSLRDEGILLYERLKESGIKVELHEIKNACHGYENVPEGKIMRTCMERRIKWLEKEYN